MGLTERRRVTRWRADRDGVPGGFADRPDTLAVEEPLEIRLGDEPFTVTMRTPGHDLDLALGFLVGEGVLRSPGDVVGARHCPDAALDADGRPTYNVVEVTLSGSATPPSAARYRAVSSACGICGTTSIDEIEARTPYDLTGDDVRIDPAVLADLPRLLREKQATFERTGGVHAAGLFRPDGTLLCLREDVGRHNAVDKVIGWALQQDALPLRGTVLQVSGRASFELAQKAVTAGIPVLAAVSAPSSLAVDLAGRTGLTLVGFSRRDTFTAYTGVGRFLTGAGV